MSRLTDPPSTAKKFLVWTIFGIFVILSWSSAILFLFIAGHSPCGEIGTCTSDRIVGIAILLLLPAQAGIAAWIRFRMSGK
jgi:hypothetical protein